MDLNLIESYHSVFIYLLSVLVQIDSPDKARSLIEEMKLRTGDQVVISFTDNSPSQSVPVALKKLDEKSEGES